LELPRPEPVEPAQPQLPVEDPPWNGWDVVLLAVAAVVAINIFVTIAVAIYLAIYSSGHPGEAISAAIIQKLTFNPYVMVSGQFLGYLALLVAMAWIIRNRYHRRFWQTLQWSWPSAWLRYLFSGMILALVVQLVSRFLPLPKSLPIQRYFETTGGAYLMAAFGILIAPLVEEMFFRGFLYPVLERAFARALHNSRTARAWASLALLFAAWALVMRALSGAALLAAALLPLIGCALLLSRSKQPAISTPTSIVAAVLLVLWGVAMHFSSRTLLLTAVSACLALGLLFVVAAARGGMESRAAAAGGIATAVVLTAASFALIHAAQLASSVAPLAILFTVGLVLTLVRALTRSLAASVLVHVGYNTALFAMLYLSTNQFRNLERMN